MKKAYRELFDEVHASERLRMEAMHIKNEARGRTHRVPGAALIAAVLAIALSGTAAAFGLLHRASAELIEPNEDGLFASGYHLAVQYDPIPLESLSEEARERFAGGEGDGIQRFEDAGSEYVSWTHSSWAEAEAFLGLDLGRNTVLEQYPEVYMVNPPAPDEGTCIVGGVLVDDGGVKIPARFDLCSGYRIEDCYVMVQAELEVDAPAAAAFRGELLGELNAFSYNAAGTLEGDFSKENEQYAAEEYAAPGGLTAAIVTRSGATQLSMAYFVKSSAWYTIYCIGPDHAREAAVLRQILDAYSESA